MRGRPLQHVVTVSVSQINWDTSVAFDISDDTIFPVLAAGGNGIADVVLDPSIEPDRMVKVVPIQLHWHVTSEHAWDGLMVPTHSPGACHCATVVPNSAASFALTVCKFRSIGCPVHQRMAACMTRDGTTCRCHSPPPGPFAGSCRDSHRHARRPRRSP